MIYIYSLKVIFSEYQFFNNVAASLFSQFRGVSIENKRTLNQYPFHFFDFAEPSSGEPTRIYQMEGIVNDRRTVNVHCQGHPSYPHGSLKFQVKLKNESVYKDYNFPIEVRNELSIDCWRTQTMYVNYIFGQEWDQASIRCVDGDSGNFDETVLDVIPGLKICFSF